jgi:hypothetical protein
VNTSGQAAAAERAHVLAASAAERAEVRLRTLHEIAECRGSRRTRWWRSTTATVAR